MPKIIRRGLDAVNALIDVIGTVTLPVPKLIPVKVAAAKPKR
jgi:hypothetical protein